MDKVISITTIIAIFAGPIIAVLITLFWEKSRRSREEKMTVLNSLLNTLGRPSDPQYTFAIRQIPIVFQKNKDVIQAYNAFYQATNIENSDKPSQNQIEEMQRKERLLIMSVVKALNFRNITADSLSNYTTIGLGKREQLLEAALLGIVKIAENSDMSTKASQTIAKIAEENNS